MDQTQQPSVPTKGVSLNVPMAIVIAGGLIALAVFFGGKGKEGAATQPATSPATQQAAAQATIGEFRAVDAKKDHIRGAANAKVTIIEYSDLECPFCKRFHETMKQVLAAYPNDVRWVYRHAPLVQLHSKAPAEANAAECAGEQGKFWEFIDEVFVVTPANNGLDAAELPKIAAKVGVANAAQFKSCVDTNKYASLVQADLDDATKAGMRGTPYSVVVNAAGKKLPINGALPIESVKNTIDSLLK
ncbi:MAG: thioredoxin domain-containing protein [Candidatus Andersenbacteria bacterium]|nr:thioredoxin domain-containing protein [Candidatus Andersenbacteria bacterium]